MEYLKKKKIVVTVATVLLGTVATVQNLKKEKKKSGSTKWHYKCTVQKHWMYTVCAFALYISIIVKIL